jgi:uncharacterized protein (TIGR03086 family)
VKEFVVDPVTMYERAAMNAAVMAQRVGGDQAGLATPCNEWDVSALLQHMSGGARYLMGAVSVSGDATVWPDLAAVGMCADVLRRQGVLELRCMSPAGFEWSVAEAAAGTAMDQLIHTWDLAVAIGADRQLDAEVVEAVVAMFLPQMPEIGRQAGLVGPEVAVSARASAQERLLGAMGRNPER